MGVEMSDNNHNQARRLKNNFTSSHPQPQPALSLTLAGVFGNVEVVSTVDMELDDGNGGLMRREDSSENSGPGRSRSVEDLDPDPDPDDDDEDKQGNGKKRKNRHTSEQIREMESLFKESPHPDENQRQQLSEKLGLSSKQIKFWFQNRRTQIKAIHERHENSLLKVEMEKLKEENKSMRETINRGFCSKCGSSNSTSTSGEASFTNEEQQLLRTENSRLKSEVKTLRAALQKYAPPGTSPSGSPVNDEESETRRNIEKSKRIFGLEKSRVIEIAMRAVDELVKMADAGEPLWIRSVETGRELLNYDVYVKEFTGDERPKRTIEASRESGVVFVDLNRLIQSFMDSIQWKEMFPSIISKATTMEVINNGDGATRNGAVQLMFVELQMLTPTLPTRELYFIRSCKQLSAEKWAIVDVSIDKVGDSDVSSSFKCRKRPSGCIIEDASNGHCKVTWVEHWECQKNGLRTMYRNIINSGLVFGAKHWMATLQLQCEWQIFFMATNVPMKDSTGITTLSGRKNILRLAQRMTSNFFQAIGASSSHTWTKVPCKTGEDIRIASRKNLNDPREPIGLILCAVSSEWLPVSPKVLFEFLNDETRRSEWDIMSTAGPAEIIASFAKGQNRGNVVTIQAIKSDEKNMWILQDSLINDYESMVVYARVYITSMQSVMTGCDPGNFTLLPTGFSILPDGHHSRPLVISSSKEEKGIEEGSLLTMAFQIHADPSPTAVTTVQCVEYVNNVISCTLRNIKACLQCEDD